MCRRFESCQARFSTFPYALHKALRQAVRWTLIPRNVAEAATPPLPVGREIEPLSREQATAFFVEVLCSASTESVFPSRAGTPPSVHNVHNRSWKALLKRAGLPASTRLHDLRHTCATLLLSRDVPVKVVAEMLGHGDVAITLSVYQSVLPDMLQD